MSSQVLDKLSPKTVRLVVLTLGVLLAYSAYSMVNKKVEEIRFTPILGAVTAEEALPIQSEQEVLPIVVAKSTSPDGLNLQLSDDLIAGAFNPKKTIEEVIEEAESRVEPDPDALDLIMRDYRPSVSAITNSGAIINGYHYAIGETLNVLSIMHSGIKKAPVLTAIGKKDATLSLDDRTVSIPFIY